MSQSSSDWMTVVLGGSGVVTLLGSITAFLIKQVNEQKDAKISFLTERIGVLQGEHAREIQKWEQKFEQAEAREKEVHSLLIETVESIDRNSLSSEDVVRLQRVMSLLTQLGGTSLRQALDDYRYASRWLNFRRDNWVTESSRFVIQKYQNLIPKQKVRQFQQDIVGCLNWVCDCLDVGHTQNNPLNKFVSTPTVKSSFPYVDAIRYLQRRKDWGELTVEQSTYLNDFLDKLIEKISDEFGN